MFKSFMRTAHGHFFLGIIGRRGFFFLVGLLVVGREGWGLLFVEVNHF